MQAGCRKVSGMANWSTRVRALRRTGLTLAEIGDRVGLSTAAVCDIEKKRTTAPRGDAALALDALYRARVIETEGDRTHEPAQDTVTANP